MQSELADFERGKIEHVIHYWQERGPCLTDKTDPLSLPFGKCRIPREQFAESDNCGKRRTNFVAHDSDEPRLRSYGFFGSRSSLIGPLRPAPSRTEDEQPGEDDDWKSSQASQDAKPAVSLDIALKLARKYERAISDEAEIVKARFPQVLVGRRLKNSLR